MKAAVCEQEPLAYSGAIQSHGVLLALGADNQPVAVSENWPLVSPLTFEELTRVAAEDILTPLEVTNLTQYRHQAKTAAQHVLGARSLGHQTFDLTLHRQGDIWLLEWEPGGETAPKTSALFVEKWALQLTKTAQQARLVGDFDRAIVYQFKPDHSGVVVAESLKNDDQDSYYDLRFPATDIPQVARNLYAKNAIRLNQDAGATACPIRILDPEVAPLDLSRSVLRNISPYHVRYLQKMNVATSVSVSLMADQELWGLLTVHHSKPRYVDVREREILVQLGRNLMESHNIAELDNRIAAMDRRGWVIQDMMAALTVTDLGAIDIPRVLRSWARAVEAEGVAMWRQGQWHLSGKVPPAAILSPVFEELRQNQPKWCLRTDSVAKLMPDLPDGWPKELAGVAAVWGCLANGEWICLMAFRPEEAHEVTWGSRTVGQTEAGVTSPVVSFGRWREQVQGQAEPWPKEAIFIYDALYRRLEPRLG